MSILVICLIASVVIAVVCFIVSDRTEWRGSCEGFIITGFISSIVAVVLIIATACLAWNWTASEYKTQIMNREYGTNYTREEVFYAGDVIDTIKEISRTRIEINGNLVNGESRGGE